MLLFLELSDIDAEQAKLLQKLKGYDGLLGGKRRK